MLENLRVCLFCLSRVFAAVILISGVLQCFVWVSKFVILFCVKLGLNRTNLVEGSHGIKFCTLNISSNHKCFSDITRDFMFSFTFVRENKSAVRSLNIATSQEIMSVQELKICRLK